MPHGPWGNGMEKCVEWVKEHKPDIEEPGGYCKAVADKQGYAKSCGSEVELEIRNYKILKDDGIEGGLSPEAKYWLQHDNDDSAPLVFDDVYDMLPDDLLDKSVNIDILRPVDGSGKIGRYDPVVLQFSKTEVDYSTAYEILSRTWYPCVSKRLEFVWGVDPNVDSIPLYRDGLKVVIGKDVWSPEYKNSLPDSSFLYIDSSGNRYMPYKGKDGKVDKEHLLATWNALRGIRGGLGPWATSLVKSEVEAKVREVAASAGLNISEKKVFEGDGMYKFVETKRPRVIGKGLNIRYAEDDEVILTVKSGGFVKSWIVNGYNGHMGEFDAVLCDDLEKTIQRKIVKTTREEASCITVLRDNRDEVVRFSGWEIRGNPTKSEWNLHPYNSNPRFDFVLHKHKFGDAENYDVSVRRGGEIVGFTVDSLPTEKPQVALKKSTANMGVFEREGDWMSGSIKICSILVDKGSVYIDSESDTEVIYDFRGKIMDRKCALKLVEGSKAKWEVHYL